MRGSHALAIKNPLTKRTDLLTLPIPDNAVSVVFEVSAADATAQTFSLVVIYRLYWSEDASPTAALNDEVCKTWTPIGGATYCWGEVVPSKAPYGKLNFNYKATANGPRYELDPKSLSTDPAIIALSTQAGADESYALPALRTIDGPTTVPVVSVEA